VSLARQRAEKRAIVARALGLPDVELRIPAGEVGEAGAVAGFGYRDRARLAVGSGGEVGFHARRSHAVVDVPACPLLTPPLARAAAAVRAAGADLPPGTVVDLQAGAEGVHVALSPPPAHPRRPALPRGFGDELHIIALLDRWRAAGVVGVSVGSRAQGAADVDVSEPGGPPLRVPAGGFAQVGRAAHGALAVAVLEAVGRDPGAVLELHAGSGNFTRHLARRARTLVACEVDAAARERGRRTVPAAEWRERPPPPAVPAAPPDTVVVDPPRAGLDAEHLAAACAARRRVVYVSCEPQTLRRDADRLRQAGLALAGAVALDLMPHTFHVEVVATFEPLPPPADD
jgi:23S rRNA (uracil1939-C5)-methyltransferase